MLTAIGLSEDYVKEKKLGIGMKPFYKICMEYLICLGVCVGLGYCGGVQTAVLMPFHLGYVQFGRLFYPLFPLFMTVGINMVKIHDCAGGKTDTGADGLCAVTALIFSVGISSGLAAGAGSDAAQLFAVCTMGAAGGFLFWGCSPAKLYLGESGALALGGLVLALSATRTAQSVPRDQLGLLAFDERDVEAAARMLASENSSGPLSLHVEQLFTQVRQAIKRGVRLYDQITAGSDFGGQGER